MANTIPSWLNSFSVKVYDANETLLFNSDTNHISDLKFNDALGGQIGTSVILLHDEYRILGVQIYTNNLCDKEAEQLTQYYFQINLIVERL